MKRNLFYFILFFHTANCYSQNQNSIWVFGDSAGIDFSNVNNPVAITSSIDGRGSCASICDSTGHLLFYAYTVANSVGKATHVYNWQHQQMDNGDSIVGEAWYQELVIIPMPDSEGKYYLFSVGVSGVSPPGLYYSIIDMNANGGLGAVTIKNIQLSSLYALDGLSAIKHGNGRDWWIIFKPDGYFNPPNNDFYMFLISPSGVSQPIIQSIGYQSWASLISPAGVSQPIIQSIGYVINTNGGAVNFSPTGNRTLMCDLKNLIQVFDFDRCTGQLGNAIIIEPENLAQTGVHFGACFSPDGNLIYVTHILAGADNYDSYLYQFNLNAGNIAASRNTIYHSFAPDQQGRLYIAPDNKIYLSISYANTTGFPYPDSIRNTTNENLSVINRPDSLGDSCLFTPYSFYLGGKRTYYGLPNNPNYELRPDSGSICDTLPHLGAGTTELQFHQNKNELYIFYHSTWQTAFINAQGLTGKNYSLTIFDITGKQLFTEQGKLSSQYFTKDLHCNFANGIYFVSLTTEKEKLNQKFIIE